MFSCVSKVQDDEDRVNKCLVNLPTELLTKILLYLSIHDRIMMRYVCRRFWDTSEVPLLWKNFIWSYKPHHLGMVNNWRWHNPLER